MSELQSGDRVADSDVLADPHRRVHRFVGGAPSVGMFHGHHAAPGDPAGESHLPGAGRQYRLPDPPDQVDTSMARSPRGLRRIETVGEHGWPQRPPDGRWWRRRRVADGDTGQRRRQQHGGENQNHTWGCHGVMLRADRRSWQNIDILPVDNHPAVENPQWTKVLCQRFGTPMCWCTVLPGNRRRPETKGKSTRVPCPGVSFLEGDNSCQTDSRTIPTAPDHVGTALRPLAEREPSTDRPSSIGPSR